MKKELLYEISSPYRDNFRIYGYRFGSGEKTLAIVGSMRGDEIQQLYICSQIIKELKHKEENGEIAEGKSIMVIPSCNAFSMNVSKRFWAMDSTDINRMFPGYDQGETTQRIAAAIFKAIEGYEYGIQMASFYLPGNFVPHIRLFETGYEDIDSARLFGLPFVTTHKPLPFDTGLLNYNWQIWNTKAFSFYSGHTQDIDQELSQQSIDAILRFMNKKGILSQRVRSLGYESMVFKEEDLKRVRAHRAGIFYPLVSEGAQVREGDTIARVISPYEGTVLDKITAPHNGIIFFIHNKPLIYQNTIAAYILEG